MPAATNSPSHERNVHLRIAQNADAKAIALLINDAFVVERVAFDGDRTDTQEVRGDRAYLGLLSVAPARQGTGLGRQLVAAAEEHARNAGCHTMDLRIISPRAERLLPFYQHLGYSETGTAAFPAAVTTKVPCHYILMAKPLG